MVKTFILPIVGAFSELRQAKAALAELHDTGFDGEQLGAIGHDAALIHHDGETYPAMDASADTYTPEDGGAAAALIEAGVGGLWLVGVAAGELPGLGPFIAGGMLANLVAAASLSRSQGGLTEVLADMGLAEDEAREAEEAFRAGQTLLTVQTENRRDEAIEILQRHGAMAEIGRAR